MDRNRAIGVFDSGLGGISVLNHLAEILPEEDFIYVADSAWCPYGDKSYQTLRNRIDQIINYLLQRGVKIIVVACNTATAAAIDYLRSKYNIPFVGMEPAIKPAAKLTQTNVVGVLATPNTFNGHLFQETREKYASHVEVMIQKGSGLVELVENNETESDVACELLAEYTKPMVENKADYLVLGCTHYPFLTKTIKKVAPTLKIIDPALPVARRTRQLLKERNLLSLSETGSLQLYTTGDFKKLQDFANTFVKKKYVANTLKL